jgi:hypothetical protein
MNRKTTFVMRAGLVVLLALWMMPATASANLDEFNRLSAELAGVEAELRLVSAALDACREEKGAKQLADARRAVDEAEKAADRAHTGDGLDAAREKLEQSRAKRDAQVESMLAGATEYQAAKTRQAALKTSIEKLGARAAKLSAAELIELARYRQEEHSLARQIYGAQRAWWKRGDAVPLYKEADDAYKAYNALAGKAKAYQEADEKLKQARKTLADAIAAVPAEGAVCKDLASRRASLQDKVDALKGDLGALEKKLGDGGNVVSVNVMAFNRKTKKDEEKAVSLWLPPGCDHVRGVIVAHPMIKGLTTALPIRLAAAQEGLGMMVYDDFALDGKESLARLDALLEKLAAAAGRPELRGAPLLLGGLSASVLGTRNVACAVPGRVFGIVHAAGGNMQEMPDDGRGMVQVPFLALNGEFEWCGPIGGIRPEYGNQTQWLMIREQMLRLWRGKQEHRMSLVVVPNADHGAWDVGLTALFVRKAAQYRLPKGKRDGSQPAECAPLPVTQGWLTDADLDRPRHEPASYEAYTGDKNNAFWHFDEEMARAVYAYHKGKFLLPDPTKVQPVPASWPP